MLQKVPPPPTDAGKTTAVQRVQQVTSSGTQTSPSPKPRRKVMLITVVMLIKVMLKTVLKLYFKKSIQDNNY